MSTLEVNTINPQSGTTITIGGSGDTVSLGSGATQSGFGGTNTPFFYGRKASDQTITRGTQTKVTGFTSNEIDSDNGFDGTTFTVPSGGAGKYFFNVNLFCDFSAVGSDGEIVQANFFYNGSSSGIPEAKFQTNGSTRNIRMFSVNYSFIQTMAVGDTMEVYTVVTDADGSGNGKVSANASCFMGYKLVE